MILRESFIWVNSMDHWGVYMIEADDGLIYTGITVDMERRWTEHLGASQGGSKGAKFFRGRKPARLLFYRAGFNRSAATQYEIAVKKMIKRRKLDLALSDANQLSQHFPDANLFSATD